ncbi:MAG: DUF92 domain-containing protein [Bacteroidetes bacterium]|nr:DUF92 domain-containing protein [Bacteroidota bacterium]
MRLFAIPTEDEWFFTGIVLFLVVMMIAAAELVRRLMYGNSEVTRKLVHVIAGILMAFAPSVFHSGIPALLLSFLAIIGTFIAVRFGLLQSLHDTERTSYGTTYHPMAFFILVLAFWEHAPQILTAAILILAVPDALAAIVGRSVRTPHVFSFSTDRKTVEGSATMFIATTVCVGSFLSYHGYVTTYPYAVIALVTATVVTAWELVCTRGLDNLSVPLSAAFMLDLFLRPVPVHDPAQMITALFLAAAIGIVSYRFQFLSPNGSVATFLLAVLIYGIGGWMWTVPILTFFIASSLLSKYGKARKRKLERVFDKTDKRDSGQVAANGGVAGAFMLAWYIFPGETWMYPCYIASVAAVTADTWGTEIGTLMKGKPRSIITFRKVDIGTSGGISPAGLAGGAAGAALVSGTAMLFLGDTAAPMLLLSLIVSGVVGSLIDSLLGATVQAQYRTASGKLTERTVVDGVPTTLVRGYRWVTNDVVNWCCGAAGAGTMYLLL